MTGLLDAISSESAVAVSRLADEDVNFAIDTSDVDLIEVPHVAGVPLEDAIPTALVRVRHWPNLGGYLEHGSDHDVVVWWPSLAPAPHADTVVKVGPAQVQDTKSRTTFLKGLTKSLEQHRGVSRACSPVAARGIVYTPGIESAHIDRVARRFPGAIHKTPERLSEFPGGLCLSVTPEVWSDPKEFSASVDALIGKACRHRTPTMESR